MSCPDIDLSKTEQVSPETDDMESSYHDYEVEVTPSQQEVITHPVDSNTTLQVIAGPGSGKTTTLVYKIAYMVGTLGVDPSEILVLSMTNRAVEALQNRLSEIYGESSLIDVTTFHAFAHRCVMNSETSQSNGIQIIEEAGWRTLTQLVGGHSKLHKHNLSRIIDAFKREGSQGETCKALSRRAGLELKELEDVIKTLDTSNVLVHSDVMIRAKIYIRQGKVHLPYKVIIVDEFQDVYPDIYELAQLVSRDSHLVIAGDPHQSIYGFLGSNIEVKASISKFKPMKTLFLSDSFRSTPEIIDASNSAVRRQSPSMALKEITGFKPVIKLFKDLDEQYEWVAKEIIRLIHESEGVIEPSDIAILSRTNHALKGITRVLNFYGILDFKLSSDPEWLSEGLFHLIDYLRIIRSPEISNFPIICTMNLLKRIGPVSIKKFHNAALKEGIDLYTYLTNLKDGGKLKPQIICKYLDTIEEARQNIDLNDPESIFRNLLFLANELGLKEFISKSINTQADKDKIISQLNDFYENLKLSNNFKSAESNLATHFIKHYAETLPIAKNKKAVKLSTIHAAKGLEFPIVFVLGAYQADQTYMPRGVEDQENHLYVAMSRARSMLYLSSVSDERFNFDYYDLKFPMKYYTKDVPQIKGPFTRAFAKEFHRPLRPSMSTANLARSFHTLSRALKRL